MVISPPSPLGAKFVGGSKKKESAAVNGICYSIEGVHEI
jgi:hypothetical protein